MWTLDELVERVSEALEAEYPGAPNGRVRDLPDRRAIRWYTTIGLVDKPLGMRGRTALYGPRHLQQLVAIKRRQAEGHTLAQIQAEFTGISPDSLTDIALVPPGMLIEIADGALDRHAPDRPRFWADHPAESSLPPPGLPRMKTAIVTEPETLPADRPSPVPDRPSPAPDRPSAAPDRSSAAPDRPSPAPARAGAAPAAQPFTGLALGGGVLLLVPQALSDRDLDAIAEAAAPLLDLLAARGLTAAEGLIDGSPS